MFDQELLITIAATSLIFILSFMITFLTKNKSPIPSILNCLIVSGMISFILFLCILFPSKSWIWIFSLFFMYYVKSVIENNMDQKMKRVLREKIYESYKNKSDKEV